MSVVSRDRTSKSFVTSTHVLHLARSEYHRPFLPGKRVHGSEKMFQRFLVQLEFWTSHTQRRASAEKRRRLSGRERLAEICTAGKKSWEVMTFSWVRILCQNPWLRAVSRVSTVILGGKIVVIFWMIWNYTLCNFVFSHSVVTYCKVEIFLSSIVIYSLVI